MRRAAAIALALLALGGCGGDDTPRSSAAPDFALRDSAGATVRLSELRGHAVLLTFIYTHCPDVCPLIVGKLRAALLRLGNDAASVRVVAVSVDPRGDTPRAVRAFLRRRGMAERMRYLVGSPRELARVWKAYGIAVHASPEVRETAHSAAVFGITASGRRARYYVQNFSVDAIVRDVRELAHS